jgi:hypothetical protein
MTLTYIETQQGRIEGSSVVKPTERIFREAWALNNNVIEVDMVKAREIWRDKIRQARISVMEGLDADFMKALEVGNVPLQQSIAAQKQALRDAPSDGGIDAAMTSEELKAVQPAGLVIS